MSSCKKIAFYTLGCKVNQYETESIKNDLINCGHQEVAFDQKADVYLVNTCTVTSIADRKSRNILRRTKKQNENSVVIVTGCYAQTNSKDLEKISEIDIILGNTEKNKIVEIINNLKSNEEKIEEDIKKIIKVEDIFSTRDYDEKLYGNVSEMTRAYVKIQDGCNNFCSYCKIPFARGRSRSREKRNILCEINKLVHKGYKEIVLIGINLSAYGEDLKEKITFEDLVEEIFSIDGLERIRIGSVYPDKITDRFISMFENKKLMPHLHISLQSCDNTILKKMKRNYDSKLILDKLKKLKNIVHNMEFTGDVIVGFPGESQEMFENTHNVIKKIGFSGLHIFPYSDRENTDASKYSEKISNKIKKDRVKALEALCYDMALEVRKKYLGQDLSVLIEENNGSIAYGYSENFLKVETLVKDNLINKIKNIKIISITKEMLLTDG